MQPDIGELQSIFSDETYCLNKLYTFIILLIIQSFFEQKESYIVLVFW